MWLLRLICAVLLVPRSRTFELQDTIHKLIEENIHLHDQLENLTQALKQLKRMLLHHSNDRGHHDNEMPHNKNIPEVWEEWSRHGISAETHMFLEQAFCGHDLHGSAPHAQVHVLLFTLTLLLLFSFDQL
ncbi:unnamed protein product [Knipowitschia caucasica]|uniref:Uncharacterized protein n=1 Tax=Knipowitschia caucasica TaxID=637954 RepID=A0AAV2IRA9_KNICA